VTKTLWDSGSESGQLRGFGLKRLPILGWLVILGTLIAVLWIFYPLLQDPRCAILLGRSIGEQSIPLPTNCVQTTEVQTDNMTSYLENEREKRGLTFKAWIICKPSNQTPKPGFGFVGDSRWLPSYVPNTYQFRRTVIILPYAQPVPEGSPVAAEVCVVPWRHYVSQIAGQCEGKFSVWK